MSNKIRKTVNGFIIPNTVDRDLLEKNKGIYNSDRLNDAAIEYYNDHSLLEDPTYVKGVFKTISLLTGSSFYDFFMTQENADNVVFTLVEDTLKHLVGDKVTFKRSIPLDSYGMLLSSEKKSNTNTFDDTLKKKLVEYNNSDLTYFWITNDNLGIEDMLKFFFLAYNGTNKTVNEGRHDRIRRTKFDHS